MPEALSRRGGDTPAGRESFVLLVRPTPVLPPCLVALNVTFAAIRKGSRERSFLPLSQLLNLRPRSPPSPSVPTFPRPRFSTPNSSRSPPSPRPFPSSPAPSVSARHPETPSPQSSLPPPYPRPPPLRPSPPATAAAPPAPPPRRPPALPPPRARRAAAARRGCAARDSRPARRGPGPWWGRRRRRRCSRAWARAARGRGAGGAPRGRGRNLPVADRSLGEAWKARRVVFVACVGSWGALWLQDGDVEAVGRKAGVGKLARWWRAAAAAAAVWDIDASRPARRRERTWRGGSPFRDRWTIGKAAFRRRF